MEYLGAWETLIHEKKRKSKISCQTPFKLQTLYVEINLFVTWSILVHSATRAICKWEMEQALLLQVHQFSWGFKVVFIVSQARLLSVQNSAEELSIKNLKKVDYSKQIQKIEIQGASS